MSALVVFILPRSKWRRLNGVIVNDTDVSEG